MKGKAKREEVEEVQTESVEEVKKEDVEQPVSEGKEDEPSVPEVEQKTSSIFQKEFSSIYLVLLGIVLVTSVSLWGGISFGYIENPLSSFIKENQPVHTQLTQNTPRIRQSLPESSESAKVKKDLKIQILNGSGISGQAGNLKVQLEGLGYENIETGNAEVKGTKTTVVFSNKVSNSDKAELIKSMESTFTEVKSQTEQVSEFDVNITTGSYIPE